MSFEDEQRRGWDKTKKQLQEHNAWVDAARGTEQARRSAEAARSEKAAEQSRRHYESMAQKTWANARIDAPSRRETGALPIGQGATKKGGVGGLLLLAVVFFFVYSVLHHDSKKTEQPGEPSENAHESVQSRAVAPHQVREQPPAPVTPPSPQSVDASKAVSTQRDQPADSAVGIASSTARETTEGEASPPNSVEPARQTTRSLTPSPEVFNLVREIASYSGEPFFLGTDRGGILIFNGVTEAPNRNVTQFKLDINGLDLSKASYSLPERQLTLFCKDPSPCMLYSIYQGTTSQDPGDPQKSINYHSMSLRAANEAIARRIVQDVQSLQELER